MKKMKALQKMLMKTLIAGSISMTAFAQTPVQPAGDSGTTANGVGRFSVSTTYLVFANVGEEKTNTHHYELHVEYRLSPKDKIGIKMAKWELFAPMGIQLWDPLFLKESEFFPGRLKEWGIGLTYQRKLWKELFASVEILPLQKTYVDQNGNTLGTGFKLYTTYHLGYTIPLFNGRFYIEPQIHCNYWPIDSKGPKSFDEKESRHSRYFLIEPDLYLGFVL